MAAQSVTLSPSLAVFVNRAVFSLTLHLGSFLDTCDGGGGRHVPKYPVSEDNLQESILSFSYVGPRDGAYVLGLSDRHL